jgi:DNA-binding HxlR family transcriptional regulator
MDVSRKTLLTKRAYHLGWKEQVRSFFSHSQDFHPITKGLTVGRRAKEDCPVERTLEVLSGKWKPNILFHLLTGTKRFGQLRRLMPKVTQQMLTAHLRELERGGIVHREVYAQVPPKVEYSLTELGRGLEPVFNCIYEWGTIYLKSERRSKRRSQRSPA